MTPVVSKDKTNIIPGLKDKKNIIRGEKVKQMVDVFPYDFNSTLDMPNYKAKGGDRFSEWKDGDTPYEYNDVDVRASDEAAKIRKEHVKNSMKHG